ncbi:MAG TPA: hypothetical protein VMR23_05730 [Candidatus Limnocylindria bacterium]|nr:hypothetical protein [Candidatus Limnocylindria bacterium]
MKRHVAYVTVGAVLLATVAFANAQQSGAAPGAQAPGQMEMCRQMMGQHGGMMGQHGAMGGGMGSGMMGGSMMGTMPMMGGDPAQQGEMMAMRGEMMKAMGDIMMKYAQRMQPPK